MYGVSAVSRVEEALAAARSSQQTLNAFTSIDEERALERAETIDEGINRGEYAGPLAGTPVGLKDLIDHKGRVTSCGSAFYRHNALSSAVCVDAIEAAGAVIIGRTGLHEWAFGFSSENPHWGVIHNPWDPSTSPGGSSGGSATAVAAEIAPIAIGTDTGGSVRVPAALCGTFGLKVTHGRIPLDGVFPLVPSIDTVGPLANSMDSLDLAYRAMSADETPEAEIGSLRLGVPQPWYDDAPMAEDIAGDFGRAVSALREAGHAVHPIDMPDVVPSRQILNAIADEVRQVHHEFRERGEKYGADVAKRLDDADRVTAEETARAREWQEMIRSRFSDAYGTVDFLVTPTVPVRSKVIGEDSIGGRHYRTVLSYFTALVNHALYPAVAMPIAGGASPPASLQVIGPPGSEATLIGLGRSLEIDGIVGFTPARESSPSPDVE